jgi:hypothetical protein
MTDEQAREEEEARRRMIDFFTRHFAGVDTDAGDEPNCPP